MRFLISLIGLSACACGLEAATKGQVTPDNPTGIYQPGQTVTWKVELSEDKAPAKGEVSFSLRKGGLEELAKGTVELREGKATITGTRNDPGVLTLIVKYKAKDQPERIYQGGAVFAPEKIKASSAPPDDFDTFWKSKIAELDAIPIDAQLEKVDIGDPKIDYYKITMNNIRGTKIYGQLAKPAGQTKLPALLQVQWAGVYPLQREWVVRHARNGWLSLNVSSHNLPIDKPDAFYAEKAKTELNDYPGQGNDDREKSYFLRMFLSCRRAVDYLTKNPDWNGKTLVAHGLSQGGYQAIVTAGIHPAVTALAANVPAGCDHTGKKAGRLPGWPAWASRTWQGKDEQKMLAGARYFDAMNFATRTPCAALVGLGLVDQACPPEGVIATCNQLSGPKQIIIMPLADHNGDHKAYDQAFGKFLEAQKKAGN